MTDAQSKPLHVNGSGYKIGTKHSPICRHCGHPFSEHRAETFNCPAGLKRRNGYTEFDADSLFEESID